MGVVSVLQDEEVLWMDGGHKHVLNYRTIHLKGLR